MKKNIPHKNTVFGISQGLFFTMVGGAVIVLIIIATTVSSYNRRKAQEQAAEQQRQEQIAKKKAEPKFKDYEQSSDDEDNQKDLSNSITQAQAVKKIKYSINYGFGLIARSNALNGDEITYKSLGMRENKKLLRIFASRKVFSDFNNAVNVLTVTGQNTYGQGGNDKNYKTGKQGDLMVMDGGKVQLDGTSGTSYIFDVMLKYHAPNIPPSRVYLKYYVRKSDGLIMQIESDGNNANQ